MIDGRWAARGRAPGSARPRRDPSLRFKLSLPYVEVSDGNEEYSWSLVGRGSAIDHDLVRGWSARDRDGLVKISELAYERIRRHVTALSVGVGLFISSWLVLGTSHDQWRGGVAFIGVFVAGQLLVAWFGRHRPGHEHDGARRNRG